MRGKQCAGTVPISLSGITPADAGKTEPLGCLPFFVQDHPRGCGENLPDFKFSGDVKGSPPRMRGKPDSGTSAPKLSGITPADAGKTCPEPRDGQP